MKLTTLLALGTIFCAQVSLADDPYGRIQIKTLPNGLTYVLAPSPKSNKIFVKLKVNAGMLDEQPGRMGTAHLLEHFLFRSTKLKADTSYLDLIQEKGGQGNGETTSDETIYYASMSPADTEWLLKKFSEMLLERSEFDESDLPRIKNSVLLEIGQPSFLDKLKGNVLLRKTFIEPFKQPSFYEREFGVNVDSPDDADQRRTTPQLSLTDIKDFYQAHYTPDQMTLYVSGHIPKNVDALIGRLYKMGKKSSPKSLKLIMPTPMEQPYHRSSVTRNTPYVDVGVKVWNLKVEDVVVFRLYQTYITQLLMKELRNKLGQTYTASPHAALFDGFGSIAIGFETNPEDFKKNYKFLEGLLFRKNGSDHLTNDDFNKAKSQLATQMELSDSDAGTALSLAEELILNRELFSEHRTPYEVLSSVDVNKANTILRARFDKNLEYYNLTEPPVFWRYETWPYYGLCVLFFLVLFRKILTKPFRHDQIRWIRKIKYPAPAIVEFGLCAIGFCLSNILTSFYTFEASKSLLMNSTFILSNYLTSFIEMGILVSVFTFLFAWTPKKLMVVGNEFYVKYISYNSERILLSDIAKIGTCRVFFLKPKDLLRIKWRFYFFDIFFWQKGLRVDLHDGRTYFFSIKRPDAAVSELTKLISSAKSLHLSQYSTKRKQAS